MQRLLSLISALMMTLAGLAVQMTGDPRAMELIEQARAALGGEKLAKGPGSFAVRLFPDRKSHRPLMLSYRGAAPRMVMQTQRGDAPPPGTPAQPPPPSIANITVYLDDYKSVDGVTLPHRVVRAIDGATSEEWTLSTVKVNPSFKADAFSGR